MSSVTNFKMGRHTLQTNRIICPVCGVIYSGNGVGPSNNKMITRALQTFLFISTRYFKEPSIAHDMAYLIAPYMPVIYTEGSYQRVVKDQYDADMLFYDLMMVEASKANFILKPYLKKAAKIYLEAVQEAGESSFKHEH